MQNEEMFEPGHWVRFVPDRRDSRTPTARYVLRVAQMRDFAIAFLLDPFAAGPRDLRPFWKCGRTRRRYEHRGHTCGHQVRAYARYGCFSSQDISRVFQIVIVICL